MPHELSNGEFFQGFFAALVQANVRFIAKKELSTNPRAFEEAVEFLKKEDPEQRCGIFNPSLLGSYPDLERAVSEYFYWFNPVFQAGIWVGYNLEIRPERVQNILDNLPLEIVPLIQGAAKAFAEALTQK